jgi:hypothetical protein
MLKLFDAPPPDLVTAIGQAMAILPPHQKNDALPGSHPKTGAVLDRLLEEPRSRSHYHSLTQLRRALGAAEDAGLPIEAGVIVAELAHMRAIAQIEVDSALHAAPERALEIAVLGTALFEPVIAALRRVAHEDIARERLRQPTDSDDGEKAG